MPPVEEQEVEHVIQRVNLQRALVVGVGGCGAEVIKRLRRLLVDRFGRFENIPIVKFFYIDTDQNWLQTMATEVEEDIRLPESERFDAQIPDASGIYRNIRDGHLPNYSWFSLEKLQHHIRIVEGAGTIRQLGRLCFWHHYRDIRDGMKVLITDLNADENARFMEDRYRIVVDPGINVYVIAGLAGGTGSGMFLDIAYLARNVLGQMGVQGSNLVVGYLILPGAFRDLGGTNALPNGYAALKELNYYSYMYSPDNEMAALFGRPEWVVNYTGEPGGEVRFVCQPPFDYCYLLDARNEHVQLHRNDIFAMIARSLFHEFTLDFATFKRSLRTNIKNRIVRNDKRDCPVGFMSFGQSAIFFPRREIEQALRHQLALRAVQRWISKQAAPVEVFARSAGATDSQENVENVILSLTKEAEEDTLKEAVRGYIIRQFIPDVGLKREDVLSAILVEAKERLSDIPYALVEVERKRWIAEEWPFDKFLGSLSDSWRRLKQGFTDEGPEPVKWGEQIRKLWAHKEKVGKEYRQKIYERVFEMFEGTAEYGPAWALCFVRLLREALLALRERFVREANDPQAIAQVLGDVYLIKRVAEGKGPSLSAIIEANASEKFKEVDEAIRSHWPFGKRERVDRQAYEYLLRCAHWCRARIEERARRLAAELAENLASMLQDLERELLERARVLARLQAELSKLAIEWMQKASRTENIGELVCNDIVIKALEAKIAARAGDQYHPDVVAERALQRVGMSLRELREEEVETFLRALLDAAKEAIGDLSESTLQETRFAVYDLLSDQIDDTSTLDQVISRAIKSGAPFVLLNPNPPGGPWGGLLVIRGAGIHGGYNPNDPDRERARIIESIKRSAGWRLADEIGSIDDTSQIIFFQECGGFPLRALQGIEEMKQVYEHCREEGGPPLHIVRDEMAEQYPDLIPPREDDLQSALTIQSVGIPLGFIVPADFPHPDGSGRTIRMYAYRREIPELPGEFKMIPIGETVQSIGIRLAFDSVLLREVEQVIDAKMQSASPQEKQNFAHILRQHLDDFKKTLKKENPNVDPETLPLYQRERDRIASFMRKYGLKAEG